MKQTGEVNLKHFFSRPAKSPFAAEWFYTIGESNIGNVDFNKIAQIILSKEKQIIEDNPIEKSDSDAYTGLGNQSLTARWFKFNVFKWEEDEIQKLKAEIKKKYLAFLDQTNTPRGEVLIQCWANVLRDGQEMNMHSHCWNEYGYLSGHITVQCDKTSTVYVNPYTQISKADKYSQQNKVGNITFFPSYVPHYTTKHTGNAERISIAFDLIYASMLKDFNQTDENLVSFDTGE